MLVRFIGSIFFVIVFSFSAKAQSISCTKDLEALLEILQATPSYAAQIKGSGEKDFLEYYEKVKLDAENAATKEECFLALGNLVAPINDNHLFLSEIPKTTITNAQLSDSIFMESYLRSDEYKNFPSIESNLDSLENRLEELPNTSFEGIYYYRDYAKIGLFQISENRYVAAILTSQLPHWKRGHIAFMAKEYDGGKWNIWNHNLVSKSLQFITGDRIENGSFNRIAWSKFPARENFIDIPVSVPEFELKKVSETAQYLRLGTFATSTAKLKESQAFFDQIKDSITAPNLIVDLRNNTGGGSKASRKFYQLIRAEAQNRKIWVIINQKTASNAEQFTIEVSKIKNLTTLGNTTAGILAYGNNLGTSKTLPSGQFKIYITDMKDNGGYINYESIGVKPEISLKIDSDWVDQTLEIISRSDK